MFPDHHHSTSMRWHHIKTSLYALATIVLAGWVTDALNEGLIFKLIIRLFFPEYIDAFQHPFANVANFLVWFIPLIVSLLIMLLTSMLAVGHFKKRHLYRIKSLNHLPVVRQLLAAPSIEQLPLLKNNHPDAEWFHFFIPESDVALNKVIKDYFPQGAICYPLRNAADFLLAKQEMRGYLTKLIKSDPSGASSYYFDLNHSTPLLSSIALFLALEENMGLLVSEPGALKAYDVICEVET